jgi:hypothetical protein
LGFREREYNYKCMQLEISYVASQYKEIYSNEKKVARILGQGFVCSWALEEKVIIASICSFKLAI